MKFNCVTSSEEATVGFATALAAALRAGDSVALDGPLGTGKTRFTRGLVVGLGGDPGSVTSPTFNLLHEYETNPPLFHFDAYRLRDEDEFLGLGVGELWDEGVVVVEWASRVAQAMPAETLWVTGELIGEGERQFTLRGDPAAWDSREAAVHAALGV